MLKLDIVSDVLRLADPLRVAGYSFDTWEVVLATLDGGVHRGRGEASGIYFLGDDAAHMRAAIEGVRPAIEAGPSRDALRSILPPGGARNAIDCALWELEAARSGKPVWQLAGVPEPRPVITTFTLSADEPEVMARLAASHADARAIKVKLTGDLPLDIERVRAIRAARSDVWLGVDGNQGFARDQLDALIATLVEHRVALLEQPLPRGEEAALEGLASPIPIAGDESIVSLADVASAPGRFQIVNIKLDKCGGLTEGLLMAAEARRLGLGVMVGTMIGTSIATAPAFVLAQLCDVVDLDGPTFITEDRTPSVTYRDGTVFAGPGVWGSP
ncbi:MAG TPA: dipeptide epimerase [Sphingomonas sp.]|nr:dipeptide epimerase [Sphingomonas sp.]